MFFGFPVVPTSTPGVPPRPAAAAEDFDAAAELLRRAGRRAEAEIEAERAAVQRMAAEAAFVLRSAGDGDDIMCMG